MTLEQEFNALIKKFAVEELTADELKEGLEEYKEFRKTMSYEEVTAEIQADYERMQALTA
jgi:hypothetical protein